jgi:iron complex transport system substrate-binding protein
MNQALAALVFSASVLLLASRAEARPLRVMSLNECSDQLVLALLPPERIASVTWLSRDPSGSVMARAAARTLINRGSAEEVLRDHPDLVIAGAYTTPATRALLQRLHYPLLVLGPSDSFEDIRRTTRQVAAAVGETARGEALIAHMDAALRQLSSTSAPPLRVAAWDGAGFSAQPGSLYDSVLKAAGARNVANEAGVLASGAPDVETLLATAPALLVRGTPGVERPGRRTDVANNPIVRRIWGGRTVIVPQYDYICGTPFSADAALALRDQMHAMQARAKTPLSFLRTSAP